MNAYTSPARTALQMRNRRQRTPAPWSVNDYVVSWTFALAGLAVAVGVVVALLVD